VRRVLLIRSTVGVAALLIAAVAANFALTLSGRTMILTLAGACIAAIVAAQILLLSQPLTAISPPETQQRDAVRRIRTKISSILERSYRVHLDQPVHVIDGKDANALRHGDIDEEAGLLARVGKSTTLSAFVTTILDAPRVTVVVGHSGAGKSAVLYELARRLLDARLEGGGQMVPLPLWIGAWCESAVPFREWIPAQVAADFGIPRAVVSHWTKRGNSVLLVDGLDEMPGEHRTTVIREINQWAESAAGTKIIMACRTDSYHLVARELVVHQVAVLMPIPSATVRQYLDQLLRKNERQRGALSLALHRLIIEDQALDEDEALRLPAFLDVVSRSLESHVSDGALITADDGAIALRLGNKFLANGHLESARDAYVAATNIVGSRWRAEAAVRLSAVLRQLGDADGAVRALITSVSLHLEGSLSVGGNDIRSEDLSEDARKVIEVMRPSVSYDESQVTGAAELTPARTAEALRQLRLKGLVEPTYDKAGVARFSRIPSFVP
jgi:hypothetical protein